MWSETSKKKGKKNAKKDQKNKTNKKDAKTNNKKNRSSKHKKRAHKETTKKRYQKNENPKLGVHTYSSEAKPQAERSSGIWTPENRSVDEAKYTTHTPNHKRYTFYARVSPIFFETNQKYYMDFFCKIEGDCNFLAHF